MINKYIFLFVLSLVFLSKSYAQIPAQGQGGQDVTWFALGLEQKLGKRWTNKNAIAYSRHSTKDNWNIAQQSGVFTFREEIVYRASKSIRLSQGLLLAERNYYDESHPIYLNEVRLYPKITHKFMMHKISFSQYLRTDLRFFSTPDYSPYKNPFQFRNRYLIKGTLPLGEKSKDYIVAITEFFFAMDQATQKDGSRAYTDYRFTENRSSLYYRHRINKLKAFIDIGIMAQTWKDFKTGMFKETLMFQADIIFVNPFSR